MTPVVVDVLGAVDLDLVLTDVTSRQRGIGLDHAEAPNKRVRIGRSHDGVTNRDQSRGLVTCVSMMKKAVVKEMAAGLIIA